MGSGADSDAIINNLLSDIQYLETLHKWNQLPPVELINAQLGNNIVLIHVRSRDGDHLILVKWVEDVRLFSAISYLDFISADAVIKWCRIPHIDLNC